MNWVHPSLIFLMALVAVYLQASFPGFRSLIGVQPDFLPPLMVYASLTTGLPTITLLALFGGLLVDSLSANPLGSSILPLFLVGFLLCLKRSLILKTQVYAQFIIGMAASGFVPLLTLVMVRSAGGEPLVGWGSVAHWFLLVLTGGALTPLCFWLFNRLEAALNYQPLKTSGFRMDREIKRGRI